MRINSICAKSQRSIIKKVISRTSSWLPNSYVNDKERIVLKINMATRRIWKIND